MLGPTAVWLHPQIALLLSLRLLLGLFPEKPWAAWGPWKPQLNPYSLTTSTWFSCLCVDRYLKSQMAVWLPLEPQESHFLGQLWFTFLIYTMEPPMLNC